MMRIRLLILLLGLAALSIFILQNLEPIALVFFGTAFSWTLSLGIWILLFTLAGFFTGLLLQLLGSLPRHRTIVSNLEIEEPPQEEFSGTIQEQGYSSIPRRSFDSPSVKETSRDEDEWNIEEPPKESTNTRDVWEQRLKKQELVQEDRSLEPKKEYRSGSVYSYGYRDDSDTGVGKTEPVYDANYRVINPPYQENSEKQQQSELTNQNSENEEDWI